MSKHEILATLRTALARRKGLVGRVERVEDGRILGWAIDRRKPEEPAVLQLVIDGAVRKTFTAELERSDVAAAGFPRRECGFDLPLPSGAAGRVVIRFADGSPLAGSPGSGVAMGGVRRGKAPSNSGMVERLGPSDVSGWLADPEKSGRIMDVCLLVDGEPVLTAAADMERKDVARSRQAPLHCGFRFALPRTIFDGKPHKVQVVENESGAVISGGEGVLNSHAEGVAFFLPKTSAIGGWVRPSDAFNLQFDDGDIETLTAALPIPGLGAPSGGFEVAIPPSLMDGNWHTAHVTHPFSGIPLDGSPISFRTEAQPHALLRDVQLIGRRFHARMTDHTGAPLTPAAHIEIDGANLPFLSSPARASDDLRAFNTLSFPVPRGAQRIVVRAPDDGTLLGEWAIEADGLRRIDDSVADPGREISARTLADPALIEGARARFAEFCDPALPPNALFDARWYGLTYMGRDDVPHAEALADYARSGAALGHSPSPLFDEDGVRRAYPALADAIAAGQVPTALAVHLHLGVLNTVPDMSGFDAPTGFVPRAVADDPPLPPPTWQQRAVDSVYQAWMTRLDIDAEQTALLREDEMAARQWLDGTRLAHRPKVSIIMPTFNRAHTIADAIQSALDQTYDNFELLICDDASEDKTAEVVRQFTDPRIRYMPFAKSNGAETRNKGLRFATGDIIAYLDSDNLWHPIFLDVMVRRLLENPGRAIAYSAFLDTETVGSRVELASITRPSFRPVQLSARNFMDLNTIVHHRHVYDWLGGFDPTLPRLQDWDLMLRYTSVFQPVFVNHALVYYRRNVAWGQVTHLFLNSGAQDFVNRKTIARLDDGHVRLAIDWAGRASLTVLAAPGAASTGLAADFARHATPVASVTLCADSRPGWLPDDVQYEPTKLHTVEEVHTWAYALPDAVTQGPMVCIGFGAEMLAALREALPATQLFSPDTARDGLSLTDGRQRFHIGTLGFGPAPAAPADPAPLLLIPEDPDRLSDIAKTAKAFDMPILVPPVQGGAAWSLFPVSGARPERLSEAEGLRLAQAAARAVAVAVPIDTIAPELFALVSAVQGRSVPVALVSGPMADDLIEAKCAFRILRPEPAWIGDKISKILNGADKDRLANAAEKAWRIALHPQLTRERVAAFVFAQTERESFPEVQHVEG